MVIVLCGWWKCHEHVGGERVLGFRVETRVMYDCLSLGVTVWVLGFRVETRVMYDCLFLGVTVWYNYRMKGRDQV